MTQNRRTFLCGAAATGALASTSLPAIAAPKLLEPSLDALALSKGLRFGTAVKHGHLGKEDMNKLITHECSVIVAENAFKWKRIEPKPGKFQFEKSDDIANFAKTHNLSLRGHTLCWNQDNRIPPWMLDAEPYLGTESRAQVIKFMTDYARKVIDRYPDVTSWDVVNESILLRDGSVRDSFFTRTVGEDFGDFVFHAAREAAPTTDLAYNDYMSWDEKPDHKEGVLRYLETALNRDVPIDTLGVQSHLGGSYGRVDERSWRKFLEEIQGMGLNVVLTELDCTDRNIKATSIEGRDQEVASFVKGYLDLTLSFTNVKQVVLWAMSDLDSYANSPRYPEERRRSDGQAMRPHPYDKTLNPKPFRTAIADAFRHAPQR